MFEGAPFPTRFRRKYTRSKRGCIQCRDRRRKCDETAPCSGCRKRGLDCSLKDSKTSGRRESCAVQSSSQDSAACVASEIVDERHIRSSSPQLVGVIPGTGSVLKSSASRQLFENYLCNTSSIMTTQPATRNGFITTILPVAVEDDVAMHGILALSGAQMDYQNEAAAEISQTAASHYRLALRGLRDAVGNVCDKTTEREWLRLSVVLTMLCLREVFSGQPNGSIFLHLNALRHLILKIAPSKTSSQDSSERIFVLEAYAYCVTVSNIVPHGLMPERYIHQDSFVTDLGHLQESDCSGTFFCCGFTLFELIAPTASLAARTIKHQKDHPNERNEELMATYQSLFHRVFFAQYPFGGTIDPINSTAQRCAGELYRIALLTWLKVAILNHHPQTETLRSEIQGHIDTSLLLLQTVVDSPYGTVALWAIVVVGSCITRPEDSIRLREILAHATKWRLNVVQTVVQLLGMLPVGERQQIIGPQGLMMAMQEHGINLCMA